MFNKYSLPEITASVNNSLQWRHNERDSVSNHQPHNCLLNRLFRRRSKKISKLRVTGLRAGNSSGTGEFPAQMASNTENDSIWWRHHEYAIVSYRIYLFIHALTSIEPSLNSGHRRVINYQSCMCTRLFIHGLNSTMVSLKGAQCDPKHIYNKKDLEPNENIHLKLNAHGKKSEPLKYRNFAP